MNELVELPYEKCVELLRAAVVGRVAFSTEQGPQIVPVNYTTVGDTVLFRTSPDSLLGTHAADSALAFEIDHVDYDDRRGWSVVAHGTGALVEDPSRFGEQQPFWNPKPWAAGDRVRYVQLPWTRLTGRRIGAGWTWDNELPVRRR